MPDTDSRKAVWKLWFLVVTLWMSVPAAAASLDEILERGSLRIGVAEFIPWTFKNRAGDLEGFEIDVGGQIAFDMGIAAEFKSYSLDNIFVALNNDEIDFIAAGLAITPSRALQIEYSTPYFQSGATLISNSKLNPNAMSIEDLNKAGKVIVTVTDSYSSQFAPLLFDNAAIQMVANEEEAEKLLVDGKADGSITNLVEARLLITRHPGMFDMPLNEPISSSVAGFGIKRGNQSLINYLNSWIYSRTMDNWLPRTIAYWFNGNDPLAAAEE